MTERDRRILETIHAFDGMMSRRQLDRLFFSGQGRTQARQRLHALFSHGYLDRPSAAEIHRVPMGEHVYWLAARGAEVVAGLQGLALPIFTWRKKQSLARVEHDLAINNFRIDVHAACRRSPLLSLGHWIPEGAFRAEPDTAVYQDETGEERARQVIPDGFFTIRRQAQQRPDKVEEFAFLLEVDMATHTNPRFAREKVRAGVAYLHSPAYRKRFGLGYGRWLVVTTGERRLAHLKHVAERVGGSSLFYFTTFDQVSPATVLAAPIWQAAGGNEQVAIIPEAQVISRS
ncbi:MAG: replication-relaxation family protein [Chloroflexi bacterium]|nr:replication-relaxation family protein [Chloroflexota bacterium]